MQDSNDTAPIASADSCARRLKVLADDTRLSVIRQLMDGPLHVSELNSALQLEQSLLSHHLKVLRQAGIVTAQRDGKSVLYSLTDLCRNESSGKAIDLGCCLIAFDEAEDGQSV